MDKSNFIGMSGAGDYGPEDYDYVGDRSFKTIVDMNSPQAVHA